MKENIFAEKMTEVTSAFESGNHAGSLELARALKQAILQEPEHNGEQLGWTHFYEFKSLYMLKEFQAAYDLMVTPLPKIFAIFVDNTAYMYSAASEIAAHLNKPEEVVNFGRKCLDFRLESRNPESALMCARNVCSYLETLGRNDLNTSFAQFQVDEGIKENDAAPFSFGCRWLLLNAESTQNPELILSLYRMLVLEPVVRLDDEAMTPPGFEDVKSRVLQAPWARKILGERGLLEDGK